MAERFAVESRTPLQGAINEPLIEIYRRARLILAADMRVRRALQSGEIMAQYYPPRGQEIISAAISVHLNDDDYIVTTYRGMHDQIAKGIPLRLLFAELAGRSAGACKGKGGSMHVTYPEKGIMVTTGIVGGGLPIATGLALAAQMQGKQRVSVCNFGDGATNTGAFHESLNMAALWRLPVIFLCQNNGFAEHMRYEHGVTSPTIAARGASYSMKSVCVDGNDPRAMSAVASAAVERARMGDGPTLIDAKTIRLLGHNFGDTRDYIPKAEQEDNARRDPIPIFRAMLIDHDVASAAALDDMEASIMAEVEEAFQFALGAVWPDPTEGATDVYAIGALQ